VRSDERLGWLLVDETDSGEFAVDDARSSRIVSASNAVSSSPTERERPVGRHLTEPENG